MACVHYICNKMCKLSLAYDISADITMYHTIASVNLRPKMLITIMHITLWPITATFSCRWRSSWNYANKKGYHFFRHKLPSFREDVCTMICNIFGLARDTILKAIFEILYKINHNCYTGRSYRTWNCSQTAYCMCRTGRPFHILVTGTIR